MREPTRIGPSGAQERLFYPRGLRLGELGSTFAWLIALSAWTGFIWFIVGPFLAVPPIGGTRAVLFNPFFISLAIVWTVSFGFVLMALRELLLLRPLNVFVSDTYFGFQDRRGRHEWDRKLLRCVIRNWIMTSGEQGFDGSPGGYTVLRFMGHGVKPGFKQSLITFWRLATSRWDKSAPGALFSLNLSNWDKPEYLALVQALGVPLEVR